MAMASSPEEEEARNWLRDEPFDGSELRCFNSISPLNNVLTSSSAQDQHFMNAKQIELDHEDASASDVMKVKLRAMEVDGEYPSASSSCVLSEYALLKDEAWAVSELINGGSNVGCIYRPYSLAEFAGQYIGGNGFGTSLPFPAPLPVIQPEISFDDGMAGLGSISLQCNRAQIKLNDINHGLKSGNINLYAAARGKRRLARQRSALKHRSRLSLIQPSSAKPLGKSRTNLRTTHHRNFHHRRQEQPNATQAHSEEQILSSERKLRFLLQKELRPTDVGNLGRIILPKKDAEANLPHLIAREGMVIPMTDVATSNIWRFRFRFWPNNKSRMYLLENTGEFVKFHQLQEGDLMIIYKDAITGTYFVRAKKSAQSDFSLFTWGKRTPRQKPVQVQDKCSLTDEIQSDITSLSGGFDLKDSQNGADSNIIACTIDTAFEEAIHNLDDAFFDELVQHLPDDPSIDMDILPQLDNAL